MYKWLQTKTPTTPNLPELRSAKNMAISCMLASLALIYIPGFTIAALVPRLTDQSASHSLAACVVCYFLVPCVLLFQPNELPSAIKVYFTFCACLALVRTAEILKSRETFIKYSYFRRISHLYLMLIDSRRCW
jgi:hypothetical protein